MTPARARPPWTVWLLVLSLLAGISGIAARALPAPPAGAGGRQVLVLTSYGGGRPGVQALVDGFAAALQQGGLTLNQVFIENLDLERAKDPAFRRSLAETLRLKYRGRRIDLLYNRLVRVDDQLSIVPDLATSWDNPDNLTYVFHLRKGVKFHNGREMVADDVVYSLKRVMDPKTASPGSSYLSTVTSIEAVDPLTVKISLSGPLPSLLEGLVWGYRAGETCAREGRSATLPDPASLAPWARSRAGSS